jgi:hypothetical protein
MTKITREAVRAEQDRLDEEAGEVSQLRAALVALTSRGSWYSDNFGYNNCFFCGGESREGEPSHEPECPWVRAQTLLAHG